MNFCRDCPDKVPCNAAERCELTGRAYVRVGQITAGLSSGVGDVHLATEARLAVDAGSGAWWDDRDLDLEDARRRARYG